MCQIPYHGVPRWCDAVSLRCESDIESCCVFVWQQLASAAHLSPVIAGECSESAYSIVGSNVSPILGMESLEALRDTRYEVVLLKDRRIRMLNAGYSHGFGLPETRRYNSLLTNVKAAGG